MIVSKWIEFCAAHRVLTHGGKCRHLHGHQYRVTAYVDGELPDSGMVLDFGIVGDVLRERVHDVLDHGAVFDWGDGLWEHVLAEDPEAKVVLLHAPPTAENLCLWVLEAMRADARMAGVRVVQIDVQETPSCVATLPVVAG